MYFKQSKHTGSLLPDTTYIFKDKSFKMRELLPLIFSGVVKGHLYS